MTDYTPNAKLELILANRKIWAESMNKNLALIDAFLGSYLSIPNFQGVWENSTVYQIGDAVVDAETSLIYQNTVVHVSSTIPTTFEQARAQNPTYWSVYSTSVSFRGSWTPDTQYASGQFVVSGPKYAVCLLSHVSSESFDADVADNRWSVLIDLSSVGQAVLPDPGGLVDANKFVVMNNVGTGYTIVPNTEALPLLGGSSIGIDLFRATSQAEARAIIDAEGDGNYQPGSDTLTALAAAGIGAAGQQMITDGTEVSWINGVAHVATRTALLAMTQRPQAVVMGGFYATGDDGAGLFVWNAGDTATVIQGMIEEPTSGPAGRYRRVHGEELQIGWSGGRGDLSTAGGGLVEGTDNAVAVGALYDYIRLASAAIFNQGATIRFGNGRYGFNPVTTDVRAVKHVGNGLQGTYFCALQPAQTHIFDFNYAGNTGHIFEDVRILGWIIGGVPAEVDWPVYGIIFSGGGTNTLRGRMIIDSCQTCTWFQKGSNDYINEVLFLGYTTAAIRIGGISSTANSTISETRITNCKMYSSDTTGGVRGVAILQDSDSGALVVVNCDGGSNENFLKITDSINPAAGNAGDFVHLLGCTGGEANVGVLIEAAGVSFEAIGCRFSGNKGPGQYAVKMDWINCSPVFIACDFHNCEEAAIKIDAGNALTLIGCYIYDIGNAGTEEGIGVQCTTGDCLVRIKGCIINGQHGRELTRPVMKYCVALGELFTGTVYVDGDTEAVAHEQDYYKHPSSTGKIITRERRLKISQNNIAHVDLPVDDIGGCMLAFSCFGNPQTATTPSFIVQARGSSAVPAAFLCSTVATNLSAPTTGVPTGTSGTIGNLGLYSNGDDRLYIENRTGAERTYTVRILSGMHGS